MINVMLFVGLCMIVFILNLYLCRRRVKKLEDKINDLFDPMDFDDNHVNKAIEDYLNKHIDEWH